MGTRVLTLCTGNICRSPLAALALGQRAPSLQLASAGLHAVVGAGIDPPAAAAARALGLEPGPHRATQFTEAMGRAADVILVMAAHHRFDLVARWPHLTGKTLLMGQVLGGVDIPDPYGADAATHHRVAALIVEAAAPWADRLAGLRP